jgi:hypothetical protein
MFHNAGYVSLLEKEAGIFRLCWETTMAERGKEIEGSQLLF